MAHCRGRVSGGGTVWVYSLAHCCRGRILASQGKTRDAAAAFEAGVSAAQSLKYKFLEVFALRELVDHVLAPAGKKMEGLQRIRTPLRQLVGPSSSVALLLGDEYDI